MANLISRFRTFWHKNNPKDNENLQFLLSVLVENKKQAQKQYFRSYYFILLLTAIFYCLDSKLTAVGKPILIFSVEIINISAIQWAICPLVCFIFYQGITSF